VHGLEQISAVYHLQGLRESTEGITEFDKLPQAAREYLRFQERESGRGSAWYRQGRTGNRPWCCRSLPRRSIGFMHEFVYAQRAHA